MQIDAVYSSLFHLFYDDSVRTIRPNETKQSTAITPKKEKKNENVSIKNQEKTTTSQYGTIIDKKGKKNERISSWRKIRKKDIRAQEKTQRSLSSEEFSRKGKKKGQDMERKCDAQKGILKDGETAAATGRKNLNDIKTPAENDRENYGKYIKIDDVVKKDVGRNEDVQQRNENKHKKADQIIESVRFETP
uniref:Uncharacterized protein n=1 Tax=Angiostrongylus cantonensis TaxID=6313 RepID=A0A0K0DM62_ANGCA